MTTPTDTRRDLLTVIAHAKARPGQEQSLRDALIALVEPTRKEDGFVNYDLHESTTEPGTFYLYENWESEAQLDALLQAPHMADSAGRLDELIDGGSSGLHINRLTRIA